MPKLVIQNGASKGAEFPVAGSMVIGRGASADVPIPDPGVSRRHASVTLREGACYVQDLGSANGTEVNGWRVRQETKLRDGDVIGIGSVFVAFSRHDVAAAPSDAPVPEVKVRDDVPAPSVLFALPESHRSTSEAENKARLRFMDDIARISTMVFDEEALVSFVVEEMLELMPRADRAVVLLEQQGEIVPRAARTRSGKTPKMVTSRRLLQDVMAKREAVLAVDTQADERYAASESIHAMGIRAAICAPVLFQGEMYGVLQVDSATSGVPFSQADLALVMSLASQVGMAFGYARLHSKLMAQQLLEHDMELARKIQQHFLPEGALTVAGYQVAVEYRPALAVGGDLYDLLDLGGGRVAFAIGDVSGKGVSAALFAAKLTTDLRYQAAGQSEPAEILRRANQELSKRDSEGMFVTAAVCVLEPATGIFTVANAGHPLPYVRDRAGTVTALGEADGRPLGLDPTVRFTQHRYELDAGDTVVLYTDGVIEALSPDQQVYGDDRLTALMRRAPGDAAGMCRAIDRDVVRYAAGAAQSDDVTILCLTRM